MQTFIRSSAIALAVATLLAACGGGDGGPFFEDKDPQPTSRAATVTVTAAGDADLNGIYTTNTVALNEVSKVNPIGGDPELCRFRFSGLLQAGNTRIMDGDIRYYPGSNELRVTFVSINGVEFRLEGTVGALVDRNNNEIDYAAAVLTSTQGTGRTITLTGSIPMKEGRPEGC